MSNKESKIRSYYKPTGKELDDLNRVYRRKEEMSYARTNYAYGNLEDLWDKQERQYEAIRNNESKEEWQTNIYIPITTAVIESQLAEVIDQSPKPFLQPVEPQDVIAVKTLGLIFDHNWQNSYSDIEHYKLLKTAFVNGTAIWQESFIDLPRTVQDLVKFDPLNGIEEYKKREIKDYYDAFGENVPLMDFYIDDKARYFYPGPYSARDCIRRYIMSKDDFMEYFKGPIWNPFDNAKHVKEGGDTNYYEFFKPPEAFDKNEIEVLWYWSRYPEDALIIVANDVVVRSGPNPYKHKQLPFSRAVDYMRTNQFYGRGDTDLLESIQEELNKLRRMRLDRNHLDLDKMFLVSNREILNEEDLIARPHGKIEVDDVERGIKALEYSPINRSAYLEEDRMKEDAIRVTGVDDRSQSVLKGGTATETAILRESTLKRIRMKMRIHEKLFLPRMAKQRIANIQQFYSEEIASEILGDKQTAEYKQKIAELRAKGKLIEKDDGYYQKRYRTIPLYKKKLYMDKDRSRIIEKDSDQEWEFFEARPEFIRGNVNVKYMAGSSIPISKPLQQQRTEALLQHPLIISALQSGYLDMGKVTDTLIESHEFEPDDWKPTSSVEPEEFNLKDHIDVGQEIDLANEQNRLLLEGTEVPPAPYITERHVAIHLAFLESPEFVQTANQNEKILDNAIDHITGEIAIIKERENAIAQGQTGISQGAPMITDGGSQSIGGPAPEGREFPASALQPSPSKQGLNKSQVIPGMIQGKSSSVPGMPS